MYLNPLTTVPLSSGAGVHGEYMQYQNQTALYGLNEQLGDQGLSKEDEVPGYRTHFL